MTHQQIVNWGIIQKKKIENIYQNTTTQKSGLKMALLASNPDLYSNQRILEAGQEHGHEMMFFKYTAMLHEARCRFHPRYIIEAESPSKI